MKGNIEFWSIFREYGDILVRVLQVANWIPHANGVRGSVLHVYSCVGNRLLASTLLALMPYFSSKNAIFLKIDNCKHRMRKLHAVRARGWILSGEPPVLDYYLTKSSQEDGFSSWCFHYNKIWTPYAVLLYKNAISKIDNCKYRMRKRAHGWILSGEPLVLDYYLIKSSHENGFSCWYVHYDKIWTPCHEFLANPSNSKTQKISKNQDPVDDTGGNGGTALAPWSLPTG